MANPINPNTLLPMSLEVDKIQQLKHFHSLDKQGVLLQKRQAQDRKLRNSVNSKEKTDSVKIRQDDSNDNKNQNNEKEDKETDSKSKSEITKNAIKENKGNFIDVKI